MAIFKQILAIDVASHIDDFGEHIKGLSLNDTVILEDSDIAKLDELSRSSIDALLVSIYQEIKPEHLELLPNLRYLGVLGTSTAKIPLEYCQNHGIKVDSVREYCDHETAEWVIGEIIKHFRGAELPKSVYEKQLGLIGVGAVGRQVLKVALALGMKVYFNAVRTHTDLEDLGAISATKEEIFSHCDVVSFHTPPHRAWLGEKDMILSKFGVLFINSCFGKISIDDDLEKFLETRRDIVLRMDRVAARSYASDGRAIIDTHAAYDTADSHRRLQRLFFANIEKANRQ